jgi:Fe-S-cluster containining protein
MEPRQSSSGSQSPALPFRVLNGAAFFNGVCDECRPFCAAVCCRGYSFVSLTDEEAKSGRFVFKQASDSCNCDVCSKMRELGIRYSLLRLADGSCFYLDGTRKCSIYDDRPKTCKNYSCTSVPFTFRPA